jgi:TPR repeat protein
MAGGGRDGKAHGRLFDGADRARLGLADRGEGTPWCREVGRSMTGRWLTRLGLAFALSISAGAIARAAGECDGPWRSAAELRLLSPERAVQEFQRALPCAERGVDEAQTVLGRMYDSGRGAPQDYAAALHWYRLAAEKHNPSAQNNLGVMYQYGRGVTPDDFAAVSWYRLSAEQGHPIAQSNLGSMYLEGRGVKQDFVEAFRWYMLAAEQGHAVAQRVVATMYEKGQGVEHDLVQAAVWYRKAADRGDAQAQQALNRLVAIG